MNRTGTQEEIGLGRVLSFCLLIFAFCLLPFLFDFSSAQVAKPPAGKYREWNIVGGGSENLHYSALNEINRENVGRLEPAWRYDTGDSFDGSEMECQPIIVEGMLYATTPKLRVIALDAASGMLKWSFDPNEGRQSFGKRRNRGLTYWADGQDRRILVVSANWLYALSASTGQPVKSFGESGRIDLREGLGRDPHTVNITATSPGVAFRDLFILGSLVNEGLPSAPGHIRAFDARSGKLRWIFHTIPHPGEFGYDTWPEGAWQYSGGANNWCGMVVDQQRGLVFAPTGSAAFDFYGANRHGDNLFANSLLCLDAGTGKRVWHFQAVKHDLWDRDFPSTPTLVTFKRNGRLIEAVAQITKSGHVFVFERTTGKPVFPIEYRSVSTAGVDGEQLAPTQPLPLLPPPFARQILTEEMLTRRTPEAHQAVLERFRKLRSKGQFEPPSFEGTIIFPGFDGGGEWGGAAFDPETSLFYVNSNEMAWILRLVEKPLSKAAPTGRSLYETHCANCHLSDLRGSPPEFPSLIGIGGKHEQRAISQLIREGKGRMPGFSALGNEAVDSITRYIMTGKDEVGRTTAPIAATRIDQKYTIDGYNKFLDPDGYPAVEPPWGTLSAIDLSQGKIAWQVPFGEYPKLAALGMRNTGTENYGGAVVTAGGLLLIGATNYDKKFHAFDKVSGKLLWETELPAAGNATPATYEVAGRQYVVIGAGGGKFGAASGGSYVAFALPNKRPSGGRD